jgi:hypothetical protein
MKRDVVDADRDEDGIVKDTLRKNTGRQKVELDDNGDAEWVGSRQSGARDRAKGAGMGDKSARTKQTTSNRKAEREFIKKNKEAGLSEE